MKKGICLMMTATLCALLFTACGNSENPSGNVNAQDQTEDIRIVQSPGPERIDTTDSEPSTENTENGRQGFPDHIDEQSGNVLVVYYSASGNTKAVAETIAEYTGGDAFEIIPVEPYTSEDLDWMQEDSRVNREHENENLQDIALVSTTVEDFDTFETVFIGYPIWWHEVAWVVNNFIKDNDFTGKTVIPFCTSSSSELGESGIHLAEMAGTGDWQEGMRFRGSAGESEVTAWLDGLDL